ncbi:MAG TPA: tRNA (adenosine(37)-N6)-threonylcarbamoyltransferase complex dimerization subunit type 1 TsaB [bacterium]|nr:tRNA (adenosine(37)-N6)-threonylcarbamoyltransferase complex dimerization subunit type 1 TsaB [bacterium]
MKILALDTSTSVASVAVMQGAEVLAEVHLETGRRRGEIMARAAADLLENLGLKPEALDAYAIGLGPGSFTGLRGSLAFVKGLAIANPRPVAGVSSLHALALAAAPFPGAIVPVVDARKGEVFAAVFKREGQAATRLSDDVAATPERIAAMAGGPVLLLGDALARYRHEFEQAFGVRATIAPEELWYPRASIIAALARPRLERGDSDRIDTLVPIYVRSSDAELKLGPRR